MLAALLGGAVLLTPAAAFAQASNPASIQLFEEGRKLMAEGKYAEACPKLAESQRLSPAVGTLLNLAKCQEALGKTASAWSSYKSAGFLGKKLGDDRAALAEQKAAELEPKLSKLRIDAEDTPGLVVHVDDQDIGKGALGTPIPVDPGEHKVEATAPGYLVWSTSIRVGGNKDAQTLKIPSLQKGPTPPGAGPNPALRISSYAIGGVGVAGLAVGGIFGGLALGAKSKLSTDCPNKSCIGTAADERASAATKATISTVGFIAGGALAATGIVLFVVSGRSSGAAQKDEQAPAPKVSFIPAFGPGAGSLTVTGSF